MQGRFGGVDPDLGPALHGAFQAAGLPAPAMHMDLLLGSELEFERGICGILRSLQPQIERFQPRPRGAWQLRIGSCEAPRGSHGIEECSLFSGSLEPGAAYRTIAREA
jgi:hypothetical protein